LIRVQTFVLEHLSSIIHSTSRTFYYCVW